MGEYDRNSFIALLARMLWNPFQSFFRKEVDDLVRKVSWRRKTQSCVLFASCFPMVTIPVGRKIHYPVDKTKVLVREFFGSFSKVEASFWKRSSILGLQDQRKPSTAEPGFSGPWLSTAEVATLLQLWSTC